MTNEEIKETIVYIATTRTFTDSFGEEMGIDEEVAKGLADFLIAAGLKFDTVVSHTATFDLAQLEYINSLERWCAQAEHRAEIAERALKISSLKIATIIDGEVPTCEVCENYQSCNLTVVACSEYMEKCCVEQAERELAEEGKDGEKI